MNLPYSKLNEENGMCNLSEGVVAKARLMCLKALIKNTGWSAKQASAALKIPEKEHDMYIDMLEKSKS